MTLPGSPTIVDYPTGLVTSTGTVLHRAALGADRAILILDRTAAHPVDAAWPDQGADRGAITAGGTAFPLLEVVVAATDGTSLYLGSDVPVRKGTDGWTFVVAHVLAADAAVREGDTIQVDIDAGYRSALSAGHTACHLASLALNRALAVAWTKAVVSDALGAPNFDALAIETSTILENGARDEYRIGKSLRKKGFGAAALNDLAAVQDAVGVTLRTWLASGATVAIERDDESITARRAWVCGIEGGARIPCGGTHLHSLSELAEISVRLERRELDGAVGLTMLTNVTRAAA